MPFGQEKTAIVGHIMLRRKAEIMMKPKRRAFTLIEVVASLAFIAVMLTGVLVAFRKTVDYSVGHILDERSAAVAQRQMELLLASGQEPESVDMQGYDEMDERFRWQLSLRRVAVGGGQPLPDLTNTVIEATVTVEYDEVATIDHEPFTMVRYFAQLRPLPGQAIAVPLRSEIEEPFWYVALREKLGREPTIDEVLAEMSRQDLVPPEFMDHFSGLTLDEDTSEEDRDGLDEDDEDW